MRGVNGIDTKNVELTALSKEFQKNELNLTVVRAGRTRDFAALQVYIKKSGDAEDTAETDSVHEAFTAETPPKEDDPEGDGPAGYLKWRARSGASVVRPSAHGAACPA